MDLEKINYAEDTGTQAIQKLDRNQRKIADEPNNLQEQINVLSNVSYNVDALNWWRVAWGDNASQIVRCIKTGNITHVQALMAAGKVNLDMPILEIQDKVINDLWVYAIAEDGSVGKFYLGFDGVLRVNTAVQDKIYNFNFFVYTK